VHEFWIAVAGGVVAAIPSAALALGYRRFRFKRRLNHLAGSYTMKRKERSDAEPERPRITVEGSFLKVSFERLPTSHSVEGAIAMDEPLLTTGRGHYTHDIAETRLWGFWDVQVPEQGRLLVHTTFVDARTGVLSVDAFEWMRIPNGPQVLRRD
jgi:hypothetical protein